MPIVNHLDAGVILNIVHILRGNMRTVQVCNGYFIPILLKPVPDACSILLSIENLNPHLGKGGGIRLLMKKVISKELHHESILQEHF